MNIDFLFKYSKVSSAKTIMLISILNFILSILMVTYSLMSLLDINFKIIGYIFVSCASLIFISFIVFVITCIISIVVIFFDNRFNMKLLYIFTYEYVGRTLLITSLFVFLTLGLDFNISRLGSIIIVDIFNLIFIVKYYKAITIEANVNKLAAKLIVGLVIVFNIFMKIYF